MKEAEIKSEKKKNVFLQFINGFMVCENDVFAKELFILFGLLSLTPTLENLCLHRQGHPCMANDAVGRVGAKRGVRVHVHIHVHAHVHTIAHCKCR